MERSDRINVLFEKFLAQQCSPREVEELIALMQQAEAEHALSDQMKKIWDDLRFDTTEYELDWKSIYQSVVSNQQHADDVLRHATGKRKRSSYYIAACMLIALSFTAFFYFSKKPSASKETLAQAQPFPTKQQKKQTIHLQDGSAVTLNTTAKLNYPATFSNNRRDVYLQGEAYFDIKHIDTKPFYVHIGNVVVKVLGTAFNIKADSLHKNVEVTVTRGKVQVIKNKATLGVLTASQQLSVNDNSEDVVIKAVNTEEVLKWKPAEIFFNDISMKDAMKMLEKRFGVTVQFVNIQIAMCNVTATFTEDDTMEDMLAVLCAVSKSEYTVNNNIININGNGCN
ncbi:MAG: FecR domain-containing protein [Agriterribacter sp.]